MSLNAGNAGALIRSAPGRSFAFIVVGAPAFLLYAVCSRRAVKACLTRMFIPHHISRVSVACIGATPLSYDKGAFPAMMREFHRPPPFANAARPLLCLRPVTVWICVHLLRVKCGENCTLCRKQAKISLRKGVNCKVKFSHYLR